MRRFVLFAAVCSVLVAMSSARAAPVPARDRMAPGLDGAAVYLQVAPSTVIVRTPDGWGSGVLVAEGGWVLTNAHVVDSAERDDAFRRRVSVHVGDLVEGVVRPRGGGLVAYVHKLDREADLALLRLETVPPGLSHVRLAEADPLPGQPVLALGHAASGLLWAMKLGTVAAVGEPDVDVGALVDGDFELPPAPSPPPPPGLPEPPPLEPPPPLPEAEPRAARGWVVQSTCGIAAGDSGGPLVDSAGELVGLNVFVRAVGPGAPASFHVHVRELRRFLADMPARPLREDFAPTPWTAGDALALLQDLDDDGRPDGVLVRSGDQRAMLLDLDQDEGDDLAGVDDPGAWAAVWPRPEIEAALVVNGDETWLQLDWDEDGSLDVVIRARGAVVLDAWETTADGELEPLAGVRGRLLGRPGLTRSDEQDRRLLAALRVLVPSARMLAPARPLPGALPDPLRLAATPQEGGWTDASGRTLNLELEYGVHLLLLDLDGPGGAAQAGALHRRFLQGVTRAELVYVQTRGMEWFIYDTDADGTHDVVLFTSRPQTGVAETGYRRSGDTFIIDTSLAGLKLMSHSLLSTPALVAGFRELVPERFNLRCVEDLPAQE